MKYLCINCIFWRRKNPLSLTAFGSSPEGRAKNAEARLLPLPLTDFPRAGGRCRVSDKKGSKVALRSNDGEGEVASEKLPMHLPLL